MASEQEIHLLDRMLEPVAQCLTPDAARRLIGLRADAAAQQRMDELAEKCSNGQLSADERAEYEAYISAANLLAVMQAKARRVLATDAA